MPAIIADFWDAQTAPPGFEEGVARLRELIQSTQEPAQCTRLCRVSKHLWVGGGSSNVRRLAQHLLWAILDGCALLSDQWPGAVFDALTTSPALRTSCRDSKRHALECYFRPPSSCGARLGEVEVDRRDRMGAIPSIRGADAFTDLVNYGGARSSAQVSGMLDRVGNVTGLRAELLVVATLSAWVTRPQPELSRAVAWYATAAGLDVPGARWRRVGMHVRRGDKRSLSTLQLKGVTWRLDESAFELWGRRVAAELGDERVLFMTDHNKTMHHLLAQPDGLFAQIPAPAECIPSYVEGPSGVGPR